jgi:hypothetical protein
MIHSDKEPASLCTGQLFLFSQYGPVGLPGLGRKVMVEELRCSQCGTIFNAGGRLGKTIRPPSRWAEPEPTPPAAEQVPNSGRTVAEQLPNSLPNSTEPVIDTSPTTYDESFTEQPNDRTAEHRTAEQIVNTSTEPEPILEERPMITLKFAVCRKAGAPNYSSDGCSAEVTVELDDEASAQQIADQATLRYGQLEHAVQQQLSRMQAQHVHAQQNGQPAQPEREPGQDDDREHYGEVPPEYAPPPPPRRANYGNLPPSAGYGPPPRQQPPQNGRGGSSRQSLPRNGKELIGWANRNGLGDDLMQGLAAQVGGRVLDWDTDQVAWAYRELGRRLQPQGGGWRN